MTTATFTSDPGPIQTPATWKDHAVKFEAAMVAVGWVKTADAGQVNTAAIAAVPASGASSGYLIFRSNDSMQATAPLFLRVDLYAVTNGKPAWRFSLGKGTDGAGALTGAFGAVRTLAINTTASATAATPSYIAAGDGYLVMALFMGQTTGDAAGYVIIDRSLTTAGVVTGAGVFFAVNGYNTSVSLTLYDYPTAVAYDYTGLPTYPAWMTGTSPSLGYSPVFPMTAFLPGQQPWQPINFMAVAASERPVGTFTNTMGATPGVTRSYIAPGSPSAGSLITGQNSSNARANSTVIRFE